MSELGGVWRTIGGRRVFIKDGQSLDDAMRESGKFKNNKKQAKVMTTIEEKINYIKQDEDKLIEAIENSNNSEEAGKRICEILQERQGFNEKPKLISKEEFDNLSSSEYIKLYRGISDSDTKKASDYIEQFKNDKNEYGNGLASYGVGHYTSINKGVAEDYGEVMEMALPKNAKIGTIDMVRNIGHEDMMVKSKDAWSDYIYNSEKYYNKYGDNITSILDECVKETSTSAILEGYDAIRIYDNQNSANGIYIILNRGKVVMKK